MSDLDRFTTAELRHEYSNVAAIETRRWVQCSLLRDAGLGNDPEYAAARAAAEEVSELRRAVSYELNRREALGV